MFTASSLLLALIVMLALGAAATVYLWNGRRRQDEAAAGIRALSAMRWREFSHFVLDAMRHRGYDVLTPNDEAEQGQQPEFMLSKGGQRWLLSCKHGSAYHLSSPAVAELASGIRFQGAAGGLLVTPGHIHADARDPARQAKIELIDGATLWPEIAPLLAPSLIDGIRHTAEARAKRHIGLAWLGALAFGAVLAILGSGGSPVEPPVAPVVTTTSAPDGPAPVMTTPVEPAPVIATPEQDAIELEDAQRQAAARTISTLPGIDRALWSTRSTLLVHLVAGAPDRLTEICAVLVRYDNLRTSRVQLQPPAGSSERVRFRQCQTF